MSKKLVINTGDRFKDWEIIEEVESKGKLRKFLCKCLQCENNYEIWLNHLRDENRSFCCKSCAYGDLTGGKFGRLFVIKKHSQNKNGAWKYLCKCDCDRDTIVTGNNLTSGLTTSCGCYKKERVSETHIGENHHNWKGGVTPENNRKRRLERPTVKESKRRDNYTCQKCNKRGGNLESHHVFDFQHHDELINNSYNLITLCKNCHSNFHEFYSKHSINTLKNLEDWLKCKYKYRQSLLNYFEYYYKK
ncbi:MAG: HNH endonuclease [Candidatus Riesia sp.]|nr:HNH endonuclease [Candidatus Riesia sp.]